MKETLDKYKRYGIKKSILEGYSDEVPFIDFNEDDPDLDTIRVHLPKTPNWNEVDGFGKPAKEQRFTRQQEPRLGLLVTITLSFSKATWLNGDFYLRLGRTREVSFQVVASMDNLVCCCCNVCSRLRSFGQLAT
jgi:hypothetical protein